MEQTRSKDGTAYRLSGEADPDHLCSLYTAQPPTTAVGLPSLHGLSNISPCTPWTGVVGAEAVIRLIMTCCAKQKMWLR